MAGGRSKPDLRKTTSGRDERGPYTFRPLVKDLPLAGDSNDGPKIEITSVELYGTTAAEILHLVQLPPNPDDAAEEPTYILASRLQPTFLATSENLERPGITQILLLTHIGKACVLCNGTLTFYTLPELSPFSARTKIRECNWVGGIDLDKPEGAYDGTLIMVMVKNQILVIKVGEDIKPFKYLPYPGGRLAARRGAIACVATEQSYDLLQVSQPVAQRIPLFSISSLDSASQPIGGQMQALPDDPNGRRNSATRQNAQLRAEEKSHSRSTSLGGLTSILERRVGTPSERRSTLSSTRVNSPSPARSPSGRQPPPTTEDKPLPVPPALQETDETQVPTIRPDRLPPHILSPSPNEFMLTTGTTSDEPGVGIFVNLEGDATRGTVQFSRYPEAVIIDHPVDAIGVPGGQSSVDVKLLAVVRRINPERTGLEIQNLDANKQTPTDWLEVSKETARVGIRCVAKAGDVMIEEVFDKLCLMRVNVVALHQMTNDSPRSDSSSDSRTRASLEQVSQEMDLFESMEDKDGEPPLPKDWEKKRRQQEEQEARRLTKFQSRVVVWTNAQLWWLVHNPLCIRLDAELQAAYVKDSKTGEWILDRRRIVQVVNSIRGQEPGSELDFWSLSYIRQIAGLMILTKLLEDIAQGVEIDELGMRATESVLMDSELDPRLYLLHIPELRQDIVQGQQGIWVYKGVQAALSGSLEALLALIRTANTVLNDEMLYVTKQYLLSWRRKKGFGSVPDEKQVFLSTDAALLRTMLLLDARNHDLDPEQSQQSTILTRKELHSIVDQGFDCFDIAVAMLEDFKRLYVLSRLYQSRKMSRDVLRVWRRIIEGEQDDGDEFDNGERKVRIYLAKLKNAGLVEEYGIWLANRNPSLGVEVFADERSVVQFEPAQAVAILQQQAPAAVKFYLEYLVFSKHHFQYAGNLINYYLDTVLSALNSSEEIRNQLRKSYVSYQALRNPRPTYRQYLSTQLPKKREEWQAARLRLLELLGGSHNDQVLYDVPTVLSRIEPFEAELVPEMIILDSKQQRHERALHLLVQGLGDYDTAIKYCLFAGVDIFHSAPQQIDKSQVRVEDQSRLFTMLLGEFLAIKDVKMRVQQTEMLLERFGGWLDALQVLEAVPGSWSVDLVAKFLLSTLRRLKRETNETRIAKALSGAENIRVTVELLDARDAAGGQYGQKLL